MKKYKLLTDDTITIDGRMLYRIEALRDFGYVKKGAKGGYVESEDNLSHDGSCWIYDNARVFGNARIYDNAEVFDYAEVCHTAEVYDNAEVTGTSEVYDNARVCDYARICGTARVYDNACVCGEVEVHSTEIYGTAHLGGTIRIYEGTVSE